MKCYFAVRMLFRNKPISVLIQKLATTLLALNSSWTGVESLTYCLMKSQWFYYNIVSSEQ
jgi:hypothetical protein